MIKIGRSSSLARDRFGEKPLYYAWRPGPLLFEELGSLVHHRGVGTALDPRALQKFFAYGYIPAPYALYRGCAKLPGGCHLRIKLDGSEPQVVRYWKFLIDPDPRLLDRSEDALAEELRELLIQAVRRRLISDVPLGVFLSGGIDSSTVAAAAATHLPAGSLETFTIGFTEPSFDSHPMLARSARRLVRNTSKTRSTWTVPECSFPRCWTVWTNLG
jgi:asparagine synthase (glutamine-hydrolysing)